MIYYIGAWAALIVFIVVWYLIRRNKINESIKKIDELTIKDKKLREELATNEKEYNELAKKLSETKVKLEQLDNERIVSIQRASEARAATDRVLAAEHERARAELQRVKEVEEERMKNEFKEKRANLDNEFQKHKKDLEDNFGGLSQAYMQQLAEITLELEEYQAKRAAINEAILRERELEEKEDFYRIIIKENDIKDIEVLRSIESRLTNREVLNKLIYEVFIKRPLLEMEKRVLQGRKVGGIYKITYIKTGESYIGRSVDIANRWKEHCLSSLNIGTIAHSTFHNILADKGLQNFTWEVLEEVDKDKQSSREKYWIEFYHTDKQFNQKVGG